VCPVTPGVTGCTVLQGVLGTIGITGYPSLGNTAAVTRYYDTTVQFPEGLRYYRSVIPKGYGTAVQSCAASRLGRSVKVETAAAMAPLSITDKGTSSRGSADSSAPTEPSVRGKDNARGRGDDGSCNGVYGVPSTIGITGYPSHGNTVAVTRYYGTTVQYTEGLRYYRSVIPTGYGTAVQLY
jgi:hypothetical protein